jgi:hypothetical protein
LDHPESAQFVLEPVAAALPARESGGEHHPVISERRGGSPVSSNGVAEGVQHDGAGDSDVGGHAECVARVVIEPGQDLDVAAAGQPEVGEVGLPGLVGLLCLEPQVRRLGTLLGLRFDQALGRQLAADRGHRDADPVVVF